MKCDGVAHFTNHLGPCSGCGYATWKIQCICREISRHLFNYDGIFHGTLLRQFRLPLNAAPCSCGQVITQMTSDSNCSSFLRMSKLAMASASWRKLPAVQCASDSHIAWGNPVEQNSRHGFQTFVKRITHVAQKRRIECLTILQTCT